MNCPLICRDCGVVVDVERLVDSPPCLVLPEDRGFVVDEAEITFWGRCRECVARRETEAGGRLR
jgi:Fe2+ or Zn2+ uptake regulation protein